MQTALVVTCMYCILWYRKSDNNIAMKCSPAYATTVFQTKSVYSVVYYNAYWFINSTDDIQMKDSPAYDTVPQTQLVSV